VIVEIEVLETLKNRKSIDLIREGIDPLTKITFSVSGKGYFNAQF